MNFRNFKKEFVSQLKSNVFDDLKVIIADYGPYMLLGSTLGSWFGGIGLFLTLLLSLPLYIAIAVLKGRIS